MEEENQVHTVTATFLSKPHAHCGDLSKETTVGLD